MASSHMPRSTSPRPSAAHAGRLSYAIFALARSQRAQAAKLLRGLGLHPGQELLLMQLLDRDGQTQSELLEAVGLDHSTVSKSLKRMQEAGLVTRMPAEHDRRVLRVFLTPRGEAMRAPLEAVWRDLERRSIRGLDDATVEQFVRTAEAIERSITDPAD
jgi:DNA-binding MarR family transcriptional regulator